VRTRHRPSAVPPFRTLDPELAVAERLLAAGDRRLSTVVGELPDEPAAARALNALLADVGASPRLRNTGGTWRITHVDRRGATGDLVAAATGLAALVAVDGWRRVKRCETCAAPYLDRTNGRTRRWCVPHRAKLSTGKIDNAGSVGTPR
jgi:predicted RNA-binding Zn ribbon-like protein